MVDLLEFFSIAKQCIHLGFHLPHAGEFKPQDLYQFVQRKSLMLSLHRLIFTRDRLYQYIESFENWIRIMVDDVVSEEIEVSIKHSIKGFRFSKRTEWFIVGTSEDENNIYKLVIPIIPDNVEIFLHGIISLSEPGMMLDWLEYGYLVINKTTNKKKKYTLKYSQSRSADSMLEYERYWLLRIEDVILQVIAKWNINRFNSAYPILKTRAEIMRNWSIMYIDCNSLNTKSQTVAKKFEIYKEWEDFQRFLEWSIANGYKNESVLERKDPNDHFFPHNVQWVNLTDDAEKLYPERYYYNNEIKIHLTKRDMLEKVITINNVSKPISDWEKETGISAHIIIRRHLSGLKEQDLVAPAQKQPIRLTNRVITFNGQRKTLKEWAEITGISLNTLITRLRSGWKEHELFIPPEGRGKRVRKEENTND